MKDFVCEYQKVLSANEHMEYYTYVKFYLKNKRGWWNEFYYMKHFLDIIIIRASDIKFSRCVKTEELLCFIWWLEKY